DEAPYAGFGACSVAAISGTEGVKGPCEGSPPADNTPSLYIYQATRRRCDL
ncbi:hypothetical protein BaRGS_00022660, partial [Batillaria attramentaria]